MGLVDAVVADANSGLLDFIAPLLKQQAAAVRANKSALLLENPGARQRTTEKTAFLSALEHYRDHASENFTGASS